MRIILLAATVWLALPSFAGAQTTVLGYSSVTSVFLPFWIGQETARSLAANAKERDYGN